MISIYSISLGCPKNRVDTERCLGGLGPCRPVDSPEKADLVFINTCGFIKPAVAESVQTILETAEAVANMPAGKRPFLAVAGCLIGRYGEAGLAPDLPEVDLFLDSRDVSAWSGMILSRLGLAGQPSGRLVSTGEAYAWLKISEGCNHRCSFCTIPMIRGPFSSSPCEKLVEEAQDLLGRGISELVLVAQDVSAWGHDLKPPKRLRGLLEKLLPLSGLKRLRLMYLYPTGLTDDLLGFLREAGPPFVPYFDIPLQHASAGVLSRMGRPFAQDPGVVVRRVREYFPEAALRTSIIVGFPGESEEDFATLVDFVRETRFHHLGVFAFQAEEGAAAAKMRGKIPAKVKEERRDVIMTLQREISQEILEEYVGRRMPVLVDAPEPEWPGLHAGRTWFQAPEVDGKTYVSGPGVAPGAVVEAEITEALPYDLVALTD